LWIFLSTSRSPHRRCGQQTHTSDYMTSVLYSPRRISVTALRIPLDTTLHYRARLTCAGPDQQYRALPQLPSACLADLLPLQYTYFKYHQQIMDSKIKGFILALFHTFHYHKPAGLSSGSLEFWKSRMSGNPVQSISISIMLSQKRAISI
jgi:hypothetical protein